MQHAAAPTPNADEATAPRRGVQLPESWLEVIGPEFDKAYMRKLRAFLVSEMRRHRVYPPGPEMFNAFWLTPFDQVRVVILGQDPYPAHGQAHGLCFSVRKGVRTPGSLQNIFRELHDDLGVPVSRHGDLTHWAQQGVLLLNTVLSVRAKKPFSHRDKGWEQLTDSVISELNARHDGLVFVLWGSAAGRKAQMIERRKHLVLRAVHPSPRSADRGFFGCRHFSTIQQHLEKRGQTPIDWALPQD